MPTTFKFLSPLPMNFMGLTDTATALWASRWINDLRDNLNFAFVATVDYTPASVAANTVAENATTVTVTGAKTGDHVSVSPPGITAGVTLCAARVSASDTVTVTFCNPTAGAVVPLTGNHVFRVTRP